MPEANIVLLECGRAAYIKGDDPLPDVVAACEDLLRAAKRGEVRALAYVYVQPNGDPSNVYASGRARSADLIFAAERLKFRMMKAYDEG